MKTILKTSHVDRENETTFMHQTIFHLMYPIGSLKAQLFLDLVSQSQIALWRRGTLQATNGEGDQSKAELHIISKS